MTPRQSYTRPDPPYVIRHSLSVPENGRAEQSGTDLEVAAESARFGDASSSPRRTGTTCLGSRSSDSLSLVSDRVCDIIDGMSETKRSEIRRRNRPGGKAGARKSERTRQAILDAALNFLWTHPFRELTVGELMSLAGTSRSAFYQYFEDLHELMEVPSPRNGRRGL